MPSLLIFCLFVFIFRLCCNMPWKSACFMSENFLPSRYTSPSVGLSSAAIILSSVLLPKPDSPITATHSPSSTEKEMSCHLSGLHFPQQTLHSCKAACYIAPELLSDLALLHIAIAPFRTSLTSSALWQPHQVYHLW